MSVGPFQLVWVRKMLMRYVASLAAQARWLARGKASVKAESVCELLEMMGGLVSRSRVVMTVKVV